MIIPNYETERATGAGLFGAITTLVVMIVVLFVMQSVLNSTQAAMANQIPASSPLSATFTKSMDTMQTGINVMIVAVPVIIFAVFGAALLSGRWRGNYRDDTPPEILVGQEPRPTPQPPYQRPQAPRPPVNTSNDSEFEPVRRQTRPEPRAEPAPAPTTQPDREAEHLRTRWENLDVVLEEDR